MIICKRSVPPDEDLQEAGHSGWGFARGRPLWTATATATATTTTKTKTTTTMGDGGGGLHQSDRSDQGWRDRRRKRRRRTKRRWRRNRRRRIVADRRDDIEGSIRGPNNTQNIQLQWIVINFDKTFAIVVMFSGDRWPGVSRTKLLKYSENFSKGFGTNLFVV